MTPMERLQAAIQQLECAKEETTPGPWTHLYGPKYSTIEFETEDGVRPVALVGRTPADAELIVSLHRTLDAQLEILRFGVKRQEAVDWTNRLANRDTDLQFRAAERELALADAILGQR